MHKLQNIPNTVEQIWIRQCILAQWKGIQWEQFMIQFQNYFGSSIFVKGLHAHSAYWLIKSNCCNQKMDYSIWSVTRDMLIFWELMTGNWRICLVSATENHDQYKYKQNLRIGLFPWSVPNSTRALHSCYTCNRRINSLNSKWRSSWRKYFSFP